MNAQRKVELKMILSQLEVLDQRLEELQEQESADLAALPRKSREYKAAGEVCDTLDDAMDSLVDAIRSLEDLLEEE